MSQKTIYPLFLLTAILVLILLGSQFFRTYDTLRREGNFHHQNRGSVPKGDINTIAGWMTFDYLNRSFGLPTDYLQKELSIASVEYPHITLTKTALEEGDNVGVLITKVKDSIRKYSLLVPDGRK